MGIFCLMGMDIYLGFFLWAWICVCVCVCVCVCEEKVVAQKSQAFSSNFSYTTS